MMKTLRPVLSMFLVLCLASLTTAQSLTSGQLLTLRTNIAANTSTIAGVQIKDMPSDEDASQAIAIWYSSPATPDYWVWKTTVNRVDVYNGTSPTGSTWDWTIYKGQSVPEQNAWTQMFMGESANFGQVNLRVGIGKIFTGSAGANGQRDHCLAMGRRLANRIEKLYTIAVVNPPANTGNASGDARGATTNPDILVFEGTVSGNVISQARAN